MNLKILESLQMHLIASSRWLQVDDFDEGLELLGENFLEANVRVFSD